MKNSKKEYGVVESKKEESPKNTSKEEKLREIRRILREKYIKEQDPDITKAYMLLVDCIGYESYNKTFDDENKYNFWGTTKGPGGNL